LDLELLKLESQAGLESKFGSTLDVTKYKQASGMFCELPKNGDEPRSPLPTISSPMPSVGTTTLQIDLRSARVPSAIRVHA
jgi:hypothetical protein